MPTQKSCPICRAPDVHCEFVGPDRDRLFTCGYCGEFMMSEWADSFIPLIKDRTLMPYLSAYTRQTWEGDRSRAHVTKENWRDLAEGMKAIIVPQRAKKLLELFAKRTSHGGALAEFNRETDPIQ